MRRTLGIITGLVAAVIGTLILMSVVENNSTTTRTDAPELASVLVVNTLIPRQTSVEAIGASVQVAQVPLNLVAPGAASSLEDIPPGLVTATDLLPGEQVLVQRFVDPRVQSRVVVPEGLQEVTISLPVPQAVGGAVVAGDTVGIIGSFEIPVADEGDGSRTSFVLHKVLVTSVQYSDGDATTIEQAISQGRDGVSIYPVDAIQLTFAVSSTDAAKIVYSAVNGTIWLTLEGPTATIDEDQVFALDDLVPLTGP